ncbi:MAG TPA: hypothetical protein VMI73_26025 [Trebonia sp.]|nr:hypothetical protein [Trebonia sp.]
MTRTAGSGSAAAHTVLATSLGELTLVREGESQLERARTMRTGDTSAAGLW